MIYLTIFALTVVVFLSRYLFLEPRLPLRLSHQAQRILAYSTPAVLTSIIGPLIFLPHGELMLSLKSTWLWAALFSVVVALWKKDLLLTTVAGVVCFIGLKILGLG